MKVKPLVAYNPDVIDLAEQRCIKTGKDVVPLMTRTESPLDGLHEKHEVFLECVLFRREPQMDQTVSKTTFDYSQAKVEAAIGATIVVFSMLLLLGPMRAL